MAQQQLDGHDRQIVALVAAQAAVRAQLTGQAVALATRSVTGFRGWYDSDAITEWSAELAGRIETLLRAIAQSTDAYLARALGMMTGAHVRPIGRVDVTQLRGGDVTHAGSYARAADVYRWQQSQFDAIAKSLLTGNPRSPDLVRPLDAAVQRVSAVAEMDAQLAVRAQSAAVMSDAADRGVVTGYRRVIHPEQSKGGSCGLCVAASDRLYGPRELMPVHDRCECTTLPVIDGADPGSKLNELDLRRLYRQAGGTGREKLKATRYQVDEHGELGPVLNPHGATPRTARQAARDAGPGRPKSEAEKAAQVRRIHGMLEQSLPKARDLAATDPKTWGDYLTQLEARIRDLGHQLAA